MRQRKVLVVVPDLLAATRIVDTSRQLGIEALQVTPGEALARCKAEAPDLVVTDLAAGAPVLDLARALKSEPALREIPLAGFHAHVDTSLRDGALLAGFDFVLPRSAFTKRLQELLLGTLPRTVQR